MKGALRLTCWQGRGSFESSHRLCLSSLTAGARWWPSRSPCWAQSGSRHCLHEAPRRALNRHPWLGLTDLASLWPRSTLTSDSWETGFNVHSPIVELPEAPSWHDDRMRGVYLWVELWVIFNTSMDLEEKPSLTSHLWTQYTRTWCLEIHTATGTSLSGLQLIFSSKIHLHYLYNELVNKISAQWIMCITIS